MSSANHRFTRLSHEELVGVKWRCQRSRLGWSSQRVTSGPMWAERLSKIRCTSGCRAMTDLNH